eukprot:scaffold114511_cov17-Tisochrysis_lutea.AAC.1
MASSQATVMLSAPATSYSHDPRKSMQDPPLAGLGISLLTLVQVCVRECVRARKGVEGRLQCGVLRYIQVVVFMCLYLKGLEGLRRAISWLSNLYCAMRGNAIRHMHKWLAACCQGEGGSGHL